MTFEALLTEFGKRQIVLSIDGDELIADAPRGAFTEDLVHGIRQHKPELLQLISLGPQPPCETNTEAATDVDGAYVRISNLLTH